MSTAFDPTSKEATSIRSFLRQHPLMTIATVASNGSPACAAVYTYIADDLTACFVTRDSTRKVHNLDARNIASLYVADENLLNTAELIGEVHAVTEEGERQQLQEELEKVVGSRKAEEWIPPVSQLQSGTFVLYRLSPQRAIFTSYSSSGTEGIAPRILELGSTE